MPRVNLTQGLREEYRRLFETCVTRPERRGEIDRIATRLEGDRPRYEAVGEPLGIPWHAVAVIHSLESGGRFDRHLHNGDPLSGRTVHVPAGRPREGSPPFTWEESATDALRFDGLSRVQDWSLPSLLYRLEGYNGWGYRLHHPEVLSPYLWSFSHHYESGKYVADGRFSPTARSRQAGAAVLLRRLAERGSAVFEDEEAPPADAPPPVRYSAAGPLPFGEELQVFLNRFPGVFLQVDGWPGPRTSQAFKAVTGRFLEGDPRGG